MLIPLLLVGCNHQNREVPSAFKIEGKTYKTGFYEGLYTNSSVTPFMGDLKGLSDDIWDEARFAIGETHGYKISYAPYDTISVLHGMWQYHLYVKDSQFNDAKEYYHNSANFDYYWAVGEKYSYSSINAIEPSAILDQNLNRLLTLDDVPATLYPQINSKTEAYFFYKISNDGLLTSLRQEYYVLGSSLLRFSHYTDGGYYCVKISDDVADFFLERIS